MSSDPSARSPVSVHSAELPAGVACFALGGELLWCNPTLLQMLGHPADGPACPAARFGDLLTPASRLIYQTGVLPRLLDTRWVEESYLTLRAVDGSKVPVLANIRRREPATPGGAPDHLAVLLGMRDRKQLDDELLRARRTAEQVPGLICQYLWHADGHGSLPYASDTIQSLFGLTPGQVSRCVRPLARLVMPADRRALRQCLSLSARDASPVHHVFRARVRGAVRWIEARAAAQRLTDGGVVWHAYLCDITEHRAMESMARDKAVAERASRAKSEFLARVSHELRTPLNAVLGFSQVLTANPELALSPGARSQLRHIESAGRSLLYLVNDVLDLTRIEAGGVDLQIQTCALLPLVQHCAGLVEVQASAVGVRLDCDVSPALRVRADPRRLTQALLNLLSNAIKYNRRGGGVKLRASLYDDGVLPQVAIEVEDSGLGMSPAQLAHLFEPFNRLGAEHSPVEGSGLGLVITRGLLERMAGQLAVRSQPGVGTCFTVHLPAADGADTEDLASELVPAPQRSSRAADADAASLPASHRRVLCVDDNPVNLLLMEAICARCPGVLLEVAHSGQAALAAAAATPPELLLIDIGLPDMSGSELLQRVRALPGLGQVHAVAVSADAMPADIKRALLAGFQAYWTKPLDVSHTLSQLQRWLLGQSL